MAFARTLRTAPRLLLRQRHALPARATLAPARPALAGLRCGFATVPKPLPNAPAGTTIEQPVYTREEAHENLADLVRFCAVVGGRGMELTGARRADHACGAARGPDDVLPALLPPWLAHDVRAVSARVHDCFHSLSIPLAASSRATFCTGRPWRPTPACNRGGWSLRVRALACAPATAAAMTLTAACPHGPALDLSLADFYTSMALYSLHVWMARRRLLIEGDGALEAEARMFDAMWDHMTQVMVEECGVRGTGGAGADAAANSRCAACRSCPSC